MGHWIVEVAKPVISNIEVIFHPNVVTDNSAKITLKVGNQSHEVNTAGNPIQFPNISLPAGEQRLEAIRQDGNHQTGAYQLIVTCLDL